VPRLYAEPVGKAQLPREAREDIPDFGQLISTLELIDGESVIVRFDLRDSDRVGEPGIASLVGEIRQVPARYEGREFSIGTPYPEHAPEHLAGGVLFLDEETFESASLSTFDGNDYFIIGITTRRLLILIQDSDSTAP
jgi:hypothetical protein